MMSEQGYKKLDVWSLARALSVDIHRMTLQQLPKFEMFEEGSQIRRSSKSIRSNIVEGFGKRIWKGDFQRHLQYSLGSCDETIDHLETLLETGSLTDRGLFDDLSERLDHLKRKLVNFSRAVEEGHNQPR
jgi:four helix bundle protein